MKILKDFGWNNCPKREGWEGAICPNCGTNHTATEEFMKAEAIKWVKEADRQQDNDSCENEFRCEEYPCPNVRNWIMKFFNLKESDIK